MYSIIAPKFQFANPQVHRDLISVIHVVHEMTTNILKIAKEYDKYSVKKRT